MFAVKDNVFLEFVKANDVDWTDAPFHIWPPFANELVGDEPITYAPVDEYNFKYANPTLSPAPDVGSPPDTVNVIL